MALVLLLFQKFAQFCISLLASHSGIYTGEVTMEQVFLSVHQFSCQYHCANAPYLYSIHSSSRLWNHSYW